jgi:hypothetical protein
MGRIYWCRSETIRRDDDCIRPDLLLLVGNFMYDQNDCYLLRLLMFILIIRDWHREKTIGKYFSWRISLSTEVKWNVLSFGRRNLPSKRIDILHRWRWHKIQQSTPHSVLPDTDMLVSTTPPSLRRHLLSRQRDRLSLCPAPRPGAAVILPSSWPLSSLKMQHTFHFSACRSENYISTPPGYVGIVPPSHQGRFLPNYFQVFIYLSSGLQALRRRINHKNNVCYWGEVQRRLTSQLKGYQVSPSDLQRAPITRPHTLWPLFDGVSSMFSACSLQATSAWRPQWATSSLRPCAGWDSEGQTPSSWGKWW